jgi:hypothetical protein
MKSHLTTFTSAFFVMLTLTAGMLHAQIPGKDGFRFLAETDSLAPRNQLLSNSVIDVVPDSATQNVLMGTGGGLSVCHIINDSTFNFQSYDESFGLGHGSVSALDASQGTIWAATAYTASTGVGPLPAGGGVGYSTDQGYTWTWYDQPVDSQDVAHPTTTNIQNVTYDLLVTPSNVWITSWAGGLRKFSFADSAWHLVVPDTQEFWPYQHLNHRVFSVTGDDSVLWVGTAAGINKTTNPTDSVPTWQNFNHGNSSNGISGNFVTALGLQHWAGDTILWAATWQADTPAETYGVSITKNGGLTWQVVLADSNESLKAHNFAFFDSVVYVATNLGLYKSRWKDDGTLDTWGVTLTSQMVDAQSGYYLTDPEVYSALVYQGNLWVGTAQGVAISSNLGNTWSVLRTNPPVSGTFAYPNPFYAKLYFNVNLRYDMPASGKVTIRVYDYALDEVKTIADGKSRGVGQWEEQWDGKCSDGRQVATGVYYYSVEREGSETVWGKVAIIY